MNQKRISFSRRTFLKSAASVATVASVPFIVPSSVLGQAAPSNRITIGCIGLGGQGTGNMRGFIAKKDSEVIALCDVDKGHLQKANEQVKLPDSALYNDFRDLLARDDVDAVSIGTPDHWHTIPSVAAMKTGRDVYCEKPLTLTIAEGRILAATAKRYGRVLQTGSQQRSDDRFRQACEIVRNGLIGELKTVYVDIPGNNRDNPVDWKPEPVPHGFDYNLWLGPATWAPYTPMRCHYTFRFILDYSGGQMTNWGAHYLDIAQWGIGADDSGPVRIKGHGEFPKEGLFTTAVKADIEYTYANGVKLVLHQGGGGNTRFVGTEGWVRVTRGKIEAEPVSVLDYKLKPDDVHLYRSTDHKQDFLNCVKTRKDPICNAEVGHRSASVCHLGNISMLLDRELNWDPKREEFVGDSEAQGMVSRVFRAPWRL
ncbi:MAG: Gfo/Idh/MocA family oxidoreductase [Sedimentisphaerales bacterium]|nr:Gfo/Idh/MocA family oxidoreductase [Sedimentisphaerales bacterium]